MNGFCMRIPTLLAAKPLSQMRISAVGHSSDISAGDESDINMTIVTDTINPNVIKNNFISPPF